MNREDVQRHTLELLETIERENYRGYDPYDFYLSPYSRFFPKSILFLHLQKFSPINVRPLLGIKKGMVTKVYGLMLDSYLNLYTLTQDERYKEKAQDMYRLMMDAAIVNTTEELGWGRNYPFKTGGEIHDNKKPLVYLDSRLGLSLIHYYDVTHDGTIIADVKRVVTNLLRTGRVLKKDGYSFIGYSPDKNTRLTFNATMVAVELMMKFLDRSGQATCVIDDIDIRQLSHDVVRTMVHFQEPDGSWTYGFSSTGKTFMQKDFHQGFVIDSLYHVLSLIADTELKEKGISTYEKGYQFLKNIQIGKDGEFFWRYPRKYPVDIHNQAQGILSLSVNREDQSLEVLERIIDYTFKHFWNKKKKCFYYQKWPFLTNRISYMRWCNAWMLYAQTEYLLKTKE